MMMDIKFLSLRWETTLLRYYLMMLLVIVGVFSGIWAIAFLGLPVFFSTIMGISFESKQQAQALVNAKVVKINTTNAKEQKVS